MTTTVSASDEPALVLVSENGAPGDDGDQGQNGTGLNNIRYSLLSNPLFSLFKRNKLVDVLAPNSEESDLTFTRASSATHIDTYGTLINAPADTQRRELEGNLIEGPSTNKALNSDFSSGWAGNSTITIGATDGPDAVLNSAVKFVESNASEPQTITQSGFSSITNESFSFSIFAAPAENDYIVITIDSAFVGSFESVSFDLVNGTVLNESDPTKVKGFISRKLTNGFYRCSISTEAGQTLTATSSIQFRNSRDGISSNYSGNGVNGVFAYGAQAENMPFATSYIPTAAAPATRAADLVSFASLNNQPGFEFAFFANINFIGVANGNNYVINNNSNDIRFFINANVSYTNRFGDAEPSNYPATNKNISWCFTGDEAGASVYENGVEVATSTYTTAPSLDATINIGSRGGGQNSYIHLISLNGYDKKLSATEVEFISRD